MKIAGWIIFAFGFAALIFGCAMDTTVSSGAIRVHNLGLLRAQENSIIVGGLALIMGLLMILLGGRSQRIKDADGISSPHVSKQQSQKKVLLALSDAEKTLENDSYKVYLVEKYEIKENEVLKKFFLDGRLYDTVEDALSRAHEMEVDEASQRGKWSKQRAIDFLEFKGFDVKSVNSGFKVMGNGKMFMFNDDDELIAYAKSIKYG